MNELAQEILVRIALTKFKKKTESCEFLGIAMRTLYTLRTRIEVQSGGPVTPPTKEQVYELLGALPMDVIETFLMDL